MKWEKVFLYLCTNVIGIVGYASALRFFDASGFISLTGQYVPDWSRGFDLVLTGIGAFFMARLIVSGMVPSAPSRLLALLASALMVLWTIYMTTHLHEWRLTSLNYGWLIIVNVVPVALGFAVRGKEEYVPLIA